MKTQISRNSRQAQKRYSAVYQQQGRAVLDSDINELSDITKARLDDSLNDVVLNGAPADGGLKIVEVGNNINILPGRLYVDGIAAELFNEEQPGQLMDFDQQSDLPYQVALPEKNDQYTYYADVWERTVTAIEDDELLDPGLHGADTCTRTQTMLQIKWADSSAIDVTDEQQNPSIGTAQLSLSLIKNSTGGDKCDPCAIEVDIDERIGNYLFRVEVHEFWQEVDEDEKTTQFVTIKWSRDNGAEQFNVDEATSAFKTGGYAYEFFSDNSEKTLGNHFMADTEGAARGELVSEFSEGPEIGYVRQWDGYCTINLTEQSLVADENFERGEALHADADKQNHLGYYQIDSGKLSINLELMKLELWLINDEGDMAAFVAGDFWYSEVREDVDTVASYILGSSDQGELPHGIKHHYLPLPVVKDNGDGTYEWPTDTLSRQFNFPPLTNIMASDVGFEEPCENLYHGANNVQQALDALCDIEAEDIAYTIPDCEEYGVTTVRSLLGLIADPDNPSNVEVILNTLLCQLTAATLPYASPECEDQSLPTVKSLLGLATGTHPLANSLNALLCQLTAATLPYDRADFGANKFATLLGLNEAKGSLSTTLDTVLRDLTADNIPLDHTSDDNPLCSDLEEATTVQEALKILCNKEAMGGGCSIAVDGQSVKLDDVFSQFQAADAAERGSIWICLMEAQHLVERDQNISGKHSVKIIGSGTAASEVHFTDKFWQISAREVILRDITFMFAEGQGNLQITADNIVIENCRFKRHSDRSTDQPLVAFTAVDPGSRLVMNGNTIEAAYSRLVGPFERQDFVISMLQEKYPQVVGLLDVLLTNGIFQSDFEVVAKQLAEQIEKMALSDRKTWELSEPRSKLRVIEEKGPADPDSPLTASCLAGMSNEQRVQHVERFYQILSGLHPLDDMILRVKNLIRAVVETGYGHGLSTFNHDLDIQINDNVIKGNIVINSEWMPEGYLLNNISPIAIGDMVSGQSQFAAAKNQIYRVVTYVNPAEITPEAGETKTGTLSNVISGYGRITMTDNQLTEMNSSIAANMVHLNHNYFSKDGIAGVQMKVIGSRVMIGNNMVLGPKEGTARLLYHDGYNDDPAIETSNRGEVHSY